MCEAFRVTGFLKVFVAARRCGKVGEDCWVTGRKTRIDRGRRRERVRERGGKREEGEKARERKRKR